MALTIDERVNLVTRNTIELVNEQELREVFATKEQPLAYIGFEPSGFVHMGWALVTQKIRDLCDAGFKVIIFWADWHAYINDKLGGSLENIRDCARYMEDCFVALGVPRDKVEFKYASELLDDIEYWEKLIKIGKVTSLSRVKRAMTVMGRKEDEADLDSSKVIYPLMQAADIFHLGVDLSYAGIDQRRANMLARDAADKLGWKKPIALHTPLLPGLRGGARMNPEGVKNVEKTEVCKTVNDGIESKVECMIEMKMSKSDPTSSINIHDDRASIRTKFKKAYCPPEEEKEAENPILMLAKYVVFPRLGTLAIERPEKYGGNVSYDSYEALTVDYFSGKLSPVDLKTGMAEGTAKVLDPVAAYFREHPENYLRMQEIMKTVGKLR
ncbi:MAG: tyrosine--tRNA ligase [Candidatus Methanomethylophilus sp.]|nr:tyrosine--tRNA ligase [Methanomethylophilus sp.]MDD3232942.1 tyrosine--tRNA ligase [Methanomethylophilus sp.]MDD4221567.1 tyrosine--tRNA ligase [Methanomethylophilus sp.]MDD4668730.1 tyrosine--tRNA ligase [Methanomethylophilus sp.]